MSRIVVKHLPKNIREETLRNHFASKGTITDVQMKYAPDGKFRQFCFIGFQNEDEAAAAIQFFNNTFIQTSRIKVELCTAWNSEDKQSGKQTKRKVQLVNGNEEPSKEKDIKIKKKSKIEEIVGEHINDPDFQEFMKTHSKDRTLWANDVELSTANKLPIEENRSEEKNEDVNDDECENSVEAEETNAAKKSISDLEYMKSLIVTNKDKTKQEKNKVDLYTIKIHNIPYKLKRQDILKFFKPFKPYSVRLPTKGRGFCYVGFKTEKEMSKAMIKDKSFIKGKQVLFTDFTEKNKISKSKNVEEKKTSSNTKWLKQNEDIRNEEDISESGKIFFRNLAYSVNENDLKDLFEKFGTVVEIHVPVDQLTRQIKGFGTVTFMMPEHAIQAFNALDGTDFHGRLLHLIPGKADTKSENVDENDPSLSFKQKKLLLQKKQAHNSASWNTLFLSANTVAEILSKTLGTTKEKILDTSEGGSSAAVRTALGETQIVIEMKQFLEENGVCLDAFNSTTQKRSKTIILAKNLPAGTLEDEISPLFLKFGSIGRIILPPNGVTALIEFCDPMEAKHAFKKLAYSKFKSLPLYLEWAPENTFKTDFGATSVQTKSEPISVLDVSTAKESKIMDSEITSTSFGEENKVSDENINLDDNEMDDSVPEPNTTIFLRNLNFTTVKETVYDHFKHLGKIHTVEIAKKKDPTHGWKSLGYGFLQFKKYESADAAIKQMQFTNIDGKQVELKRSDRVLKSENNNSSNQRKSITLTKQTGSKILVRNIPFQAKPNEIRDIFKVFGEIRFIRLPMKLTAGENTHRGFGFVDFTTKNDAKNAFNTLSQSTHLYGRRLVLEWASTTDEVEDLRKRTADQFDLRQMKSIAGKRSKKSQFNEDTMSVLPSSNTNDDY